MRWDRNQYSRNEKEVHADTASGRYRISRAGRPGLYKLTFGNGEGVTTLLRSNDREMLRQFAEEHARKSTS